MLVAEKEHTLIVEMKPAERYVDYFNSGRDRWSANPFLLDGFDSVDNDMFLLTIPIAEGEGVFSVSAPIANRMGSGPVSAESGFFCTSTALFISFFSRASFLCIPSAHNFAR
uniref:Uncharacterized protein n=1 Tax=Palpitomonas bilix TaxID=652834 RepID=A0A7S3FZY4_9EUKA|mmetsp:Transcript_17531/g.43703  ORF Transcript_17531/g.43703 Transcript_17531/m.43703 type:complete len:112 (+) Transcript_17531:145-480(+)